MKTSIPEQTIYFYVKKYIDPFATNNLVRIGKYTADVAFTHHGSLYNVEYDAYSTHSKRFQADVLRDNVFRDNNYTIIRMRDRGLSFLPDVINILFDFKDYRKASIALANKGINQFLSLFNDDLIVDINNDLPIIRQMYKEKVS